MFFQKNTSPYIGQEDEWCQGSFHPTRYVVALNLSAGKAKREFAHPGSDGLDHINAFDLAEVGRMHMGQINLIKVSSFCGPNGLVWGRDIARHEDFEKTQKFSVRQWNGADIPVHDLEPLVSAAQTLFGTNDARRFPIAPGSHCPCAAKYVTHAGKGTLFAALGVGFTKDRAAHLFMEDAGILPEGETFDDAMRLVVETSLARSVMQIAENQKMTCTSVAVGTVHIEVAEDEVGCCMVVAPYFHLARNAVPGGNLDVLRHISL